MDDETRLLFACHECSYGRCWDCVHLTVGGFCSHACFWLFRQTQGGPVHDDIDDTEYATEGDLDVTDLPEPTDPATIPADEGDAGAVQ